MNDNRYQAGRGQTVYPAGNGQPRPAEPDAPDFMQYAAAQLRLVIAGIDGRAEELARQSGGKPAAEWTQEVREARLAVADRLIALAEIQYSLPEDEGGDEGGEDEDDYGRR